MSVPDPLTGPLQLLCMCGLPGVPTCPGELTGAVADDLTPDPTQSAADLSISHFSTTSVSLEMSMKVRNDVGAVKPVRGSISTEWLKRSGSLFLTCPHDCHTKLK